MIGTHVYRGLVAIGLVSCVSQVACAAVFDQPSPSSVTQRVAGSAPSGLSWESVATGTALPIRSSGTHNGLPGAVAYWNVDTGLLQVDPRGWDLALFNFTYTSGTVNTSGTTPGPLTYASGTTPPSAIVSDPVGRARTLPAGTWQLITCAPARVAGAVSLTIQPTLAASYSPGNGAASGASPYGRLNAGLPPSPVADGPLSTPGWLNQPWSFPADMVSSGSVPSMTVADWRVFGVTGHPNANVLGFGGFQGVFQYTVNGVRGHQIGPVIPVAVPEPGGAALAGVGIVMAAGIGFLRRRVRPRVATRGTSPASVAG